MPVLPEPNPVEKAMFKVTIRGLLSSAIWLIVCSLNYDDLCESISRYDGFVEAVETLFNCEAELVKVALIAIARRSGSQISVRSQLEFGFIMDSFRVEDPEQYAGMKVFTVEARLAKK